MIFLFLNESVRIITKSFGKFYSNSTVNTDLEILNTLVFYVSSTKDEIISRIFSFSLGGLSRFGTLYFDSCIYNFKMRRLSMIDRAIEIYDCNSVN